jgi:hypothetical protein
MSMTCGHCMMTRLDWPDTIPGLSDLFSRNHVVLLGRLVWEVLFPGDLARAGIHTMRAKLSSAQSHCPLGSEMLTNM